MESSNSLTFNEYQKQASKTAVYAESLKIMGLPESVYFMYPVLGLAGESGEVCEKIKKILRDKKGIATEKDIADIGAEAGDLLWYISELVGRFNLNLGEIAQNNLNKLQDRQKRSVLHGEGDKR